jgi:UPF0755 protein
MRSLERIKKILGRRILPPKRRTTLIGAISLAALFALWLLFAPPLSFSGPETVKIKDGMTLTEIGEEFKDHDIIHSPVVFDTIVLIFAGEKGAQAGTYYFNMPHSVFAVAWRVIRGEYGIDPVRVVIPEGSSVADISGILAKDIPDFDTKTFLAEAKGMEGELFPDTYFFLPDITPEDAIAAMNANFKAKMSSISPLIAASGHTPDDVVIMASILEKEALTYDDRRIVAGILWKRISIGMPLQVDATFLYINGKNTYQLTTDDLATDSPYNTYKYKGLPPTPIDNPGLDALRAAADPEDSDYLYYLSDKSGTIHYATDFAEHEENRYLYLN